MITISNTCAPVKTILGYPVTVDEVKSQINWDKNDFDFDDYIQSVIIPSATVQCSNYINADIAPTLNILTGYNFSGDSVRINSGYFISISNLIMDSSTLISTYSIKDYRRYFTIEFDSNIESDPLKIEYLAGFPEGKCPVDIKRAILMAAADAFSVERNSWVLSSYAKKTDAIETLLWPYRIEYW